MPRTKVSKSSKRFREESSREEKKREFEAAMDSFLDTIDRKCNQHISEIEAALNMLTQRTNATLLQMRMGDYMKMGLQDDCNQSNLSLIAASSNIANSHSRTLLSGTKLLNPNDEGYLTEDSSNGGSGIGVANTLAAYTSVTRASSNSSSTQQLLSLSTASSSQQQQRNRTPGPLCSARARRPRRSRSACSDFVSGPALQPKPCSSGSGVLEPHTSRSKMRTPLAARTKAFSAERTPQLARQTFNSSQSPSAAFMRWPKPGEMVLSKCGSPLVAQIMPDGYANVNIPVRNGVLSLRPKKLADIKPDLVRDIDPETLNQIRTLHANLNLIMKMADNNQ